MRRWGEQLWQQVGHHPDLLATTREWEQLLGADFAVGSQLLVTTQEIASAWECGLPGTQGCCRQIVEHARDRLVAVCPERRCDKVSVDRALLILRRLDLKRLAQELASVVGLDRTDVRAVESGVLGRAQPPAHRLGSRRFGAETVAFYFTRSGASADALPLLDQIRRRDPSGEVVLFTPGDASVDASVREAAVSRGLTLLALDQIAVAENGRLAIDLSGFVVAHRFPGMDPSTFLWPRYWLVLDPREGRYWYAGQPIQFPTRSRLPQALLMALAGRPGENVVRNDLCPAMWPDEYGGKKTLEIDWDRRIRDQKSALSGLLAAAGAGADSLPGDPIRAVAGSDVDGGYVLDIPANRVFWWSQSTA